MTGPRKYKYFHLAPLGVSALLLSNLLACGDGGGKPDPDPDPPRVDSIALSPSLISFDALGDTVRATGTVLDQYGDPMAGVTVVWASNDATIATVDPSGLVTSRRDGATEIRAQAGSERGSLSVEVAQLPSSLVALEGDHQFHWSGFLLRNPLKVRVADGAGTAVVGKDVTWKILAGEGTILPEAARTDSEGKVNARWILGTGASGVQRVSAKVVGLDSLVFEATGSAPLALLNASPLTAPMLDTLTGTLLTLDSLGAPESGIPVEFEAITGFGEIVQGPTTTDINGEMEARWALGPTPGPQNVTAVRTDIDAELKLVAQATGILDPWPFTVVAPGFSHTCAIDNAWAAHCWGLNDRSQLATEDTLPVLSPQSLPSALTWSQIGAGDSHTCGLTTGGQIYCWGEGYQTGHPGDSTTLVPAPAMVAGGPWEALTVGGYHVCARKADGTAWCWGYEFEGRLGNGVLTPTNVPTLVGGGFTWTQLSGGHFHTCGIAPDGKAYCWGLGTSGQRGDGGVIDKASPVLVAGGRSWAKVSAGRVHSCGITTAGQAFCWGESGFNQLGNGSTSRQTSPVNVSGGRLWTDIAAGWVHTCGVDASQKLYCWGLAGFVGLGVFGASTPAVVLPAYNWESVRTKGIHTCAITTSKETYCWGSNAFGQLGIGNAETFQVPRMVVRGVILP
ncbi:MAG: Ig-like domain-containing protein [Longimicrobiales bacterium]|nr:Ig-like domain-containing protein [Longimicrobiales bacterium]